MPDGYHGAMPASIFRDIVLNANCRSRPLLFEVSRMNAYRNAGLYRGSADPQDRPEHIMGVCLNEFPERTIRTADGGIEALGWRDALSTLIIERQIEPNETIRTWLGGDGVAYALGKRKAEGIVAEISSR